MWEPSDPPCDECSKPWVILSESADAFKVWNKCHETRGINMTMSGSIPAKVRPADIKAVCDGLKCDPEVFSRVITIENIAYPKIVQENQNNAPKS